MTDNSEPDAVPTLDDPNLPGWLLSRGLGELTRALDTENTFSEQATAAHYAGLFFAGSQALSLAKLAQSIPELNTATWAMLTGAALDARGVTNLIDDEDEEDAELYVREHLRRVIAAYIGAAR